MSANEGQVAGRKPAKTRYLQNFILREDNTAMAFPIQKWNPEAERRDDSGTKGSFVAISNAKPDYQQTPYAIPHVAARAIKAGDKPMVFFRLGTSSRGEEQLSCYLNITDNDEVAGQTGSGVSETVASTETPLG